jgi:hypothetical protein
MNLTDSAATAADKIDQIQILPYFLNTASRFSGTELVSGMAQV